MPLRHVGAVITIMIACRRAKAQASYHYSRAICRLLKHTSIRFARWHYRSYAERFEHAISTFRLLLLQRYYYEPPTEYI